MSNYAYLKTDIINTTENDSTEFANQIPYFVQKSEIRLTKDLDDAGLTSYSSFTFTASDPVVSLPTETRIIRNVTYKTSASSNITTLLQRPYEYAIDYWGYASASTPLGLASATGTSATTSNYFSEYCYNALFYACMMEAVRFQKDSQGMQMWQGDYVNAVEGLRNQARRTRQDDMETPANPVGGPNTLVPGSQ